MISTPDDAHHHAALSGQSPSTSLIYDVWMIIPWAMIHPCLTVVAGRSQNSWRIWVVDNFWSMCYPSYDYRRCTQPRSLVARDRLVAMVNAYVNEYRRRPCLAQIAPPSPKTTLRPLRLKGTTFITLAATLMTASISSAHIRLEAYRNSL